MLFGALNSWRLVEQLEEKVGAFQELIFYCERERYGNGL
jgi:hypothetical protein